jgi:hypothetical protein
MSVVVSTAIAAVSALAAVASFLVYLYFVRRSDLSAAREEALALAETRRQVIRELRGRLETVEQQQKRARAQCERRVRELRAALDRTKAEARDDAYQTQHFYAAALTDLLNDIRRDLERTPPDTDAALDRIRKMLAGERGAKTPLGRHGGR